MLQRHDVVVSVSVGDRTRLIEVVEACSLVAAPGAPGCPLRLHLVPIFGLVA